MAAANARVQAVEALQARLGRPMADPDLLERALTHASAGEGVRDAPDNERLEFLGDRVLGLVVAERLVAASPAASEGEMAVRLNLLVSRTACAAVARRIGLGAALRLSKARTPSQSGRDQRPHPGRRHARRIDGGGLSRRRTRGGARACSTRSGVEGPRSAWTP